MKLGSADITAIKLGAVDVTKVMLGGTEVWTSDAGTPPEEYEYGITTLGTLASFSYTEQKGWRFGWRRSDRSCLGARLYFPGASGAEVARLWRIRDEALLASADITPVGDAWVEVLWESPITLEAGARYAITTRHVSASSRSAYVSSDNANPGFAFNEHAWWIAGVGEDSNAFPGTTTTRVRGIMDFIVSDAFTEIDSPLIADAPVSSSGSSSVQGGWEFETVPAITVTHARVYMPAANNEVVRLWRVSDQTLLGSAPVTSAVDAWVEVEFPSPISLAAGTRYIVTTRESTGASRTRYALFNTDVGAVDPTVTYVRGRFVNGDGFPSSTHSNPTNVVDLRYVLP